MILWVPGNNFPVNWNSLAKGFIYAPANKFHEKVL